MRVFRWVVFAALGSALGLVLVLGPLPRQDDALAYHKAEEQRLLELINWYRQANGVGLLVPSETLSVAAWRHSADMATYDFLSHKTRESSYYPEGSWYTDRLAWEGYPTNVYSAENIAMGYTTAEEVFETWRLSPDHDANMLYEPYTAVGIGKVGSYWTADFGSVADP